MCTANLPVRRSARSSQEGVKYICSRSLPLDRQTTTDSVIGKSIATAALNDEAKCLRELSRLRMVAVHPRPLPASNLARQLGWRYLPMHRRARLDAARAVIDATPPFLPLTVRTLFRSNKFAWSDSPSAKGTKRAVDRLYDYIM